MSVSCDFSRAIRRALEKLSEDMVEVDTYLEPVNVRGMPDNVVARITHTERSLPDVTIHFHSNADPKWCASVVAAVIPLCR